MPAGDGTGPWGLSNGWCRRRSAQGRGRQYVGGARVRRKGNWLLGILAPLVVAVVHELRSPAGLLHGPVFGALEGRNDPRDEDRKSTNRLGRIGHQEEL